MLSSRRGLQVITACLEQNICLQSRFVTAVISLPTGDGSEHPDVRINLHGFEVVWLPKNYVTSCMFG